MAVILLVDDERSILTFIASMLRKSGHEVLTASNGLEGLAVFRSYADLIDLVITDMKMPVMDGFELIGRIRETRADMKIICMSGYFDGKLPERTALLKKPFLPEQLRSCMQRILSPLCGEA